MSRFRITLASAIALLAAISGCNAVGAPFENWPGGWGGVPEQWEPEAWTAAETSDEREMIE